MRHVQAAVDEARARELLNRGWGALLRSLVRPRNAERKFELIWMPAYLITIGMRSTQGLSELTCFVDGCSGSFALFDMHDAIVDEDFESKTFAKTVDQGVAQSIAREEIVKVILRRRSRAGKPIPETTKDIELLSYPYWVYYYQRRGGLVDIRVLDAATGRPVGNKIRLGVLDAFKAAAHATD